MIEGIAQHDILKLPDYRAKPLPKKWVVIAER
jgi:hypothetical protein